ncbi:MAG: hypothetical protein ACREJ3_12970, partial [Polyangiaceae bacterium]
MTRPLAAIGPLAILLSCAGFAASCLYSPATWAEDVEPAVPAAAQPAQTDESEDSGLGLEWVYINGGAGFGYTNMASFSATNLAVQKASSSGPSFDIGAGVRLLFFTVGLRARDLVLSDFNLWELDGEAAFHMRIWHLDPYLGIRGGYATVGSFNGGALAGSSADVSVHGFNVGPMFGMDYYFSSLVSLGAEVNAELLFLQRPQPPLPPGVTQADVAMLPPQDQQLYKVSGSS